MESGVKRTAASHANGGAQRRRPLSTATAPLLLTCTLLTLSGSAQPVPSASCSPLSGEQVVNNLVRMNLERAKALPAYRSTRTYHVDYRGFPASRSAEMVVDVKYEPPGTKSFAVRSETGSKLIIDRVFKKLLEGEREALDAENQSRTALNRDNYAFTLLGCESTTAGAMYMLAVEPKVTSKFLYRGTIWVDVNDFAVARIAAEPAKNPSFWIRQTEIEQVYGKVNEFWLPARNHSVTTVRLGGHADFTIEYKDYQLTAATGSSAGTNAPAERVDHQRRAAPTKANGAGGEEISMCSDAQFWMPETKAGTYEEQAVEVLAPASVAFADDSPKPARMSRSRLARWSTSCLRLLAWAFGVGLMTMVRSGRKDRAGFRTNGRTARS